MVRKLGSWMVVMGLALPALGAGKPGAITGFVKNAAGVPQMGAIVELFTSAASPRPVKVFTDVRGFYTAANLDPGTYHVKVSAPSFLPSLRENVLLRSGASVMVNVTLNTLFEAMQLLPARRVTPEDDDWKWTLRSAANRPILRVLDGGPLVVSQHNSEDKTLKARVAFLAGSAGQGFGANSDVSTRFSIEHSLFSAGTLSVGGDVGGSEGPSGVLRAAYSHPMGNGSTPEVAVTVRRFMAPFADSRSLAAQALTLSASDSINLMNVLELKAGTEFQAVQFLGRATAIRPFGSADLHLGANTVLEYQYATSVPTTRWSKGFDTAPADFTETSPRMSLAAGEPAIERARHQEISLSRRMRNTSFQVAAYSDHIANTALTGAGDVAYDGMEMIPDIYSDTFTYNGGALDTNGLRFVVQQKFNDNLSATVDYSYGGVLDLVGSNLDWTAVRSGIHAERRHSVTGKVAGVAPRAHTRWLASYKWTSGAALEPVDMFNVSAGQADPFLNIFLRQPLPGMRFMPGKFEALVDLRNLLAQGYVPVIGRDGHTVYLVQTARSVRGGVAFVF